jgi:hypothetical protein
VFDNKRQVAQENVTSQNTDPSVTDSAVRSEEDDKIDLNNYLLITQYSNFVSTLWGDIFDLNYYCQEGIIAHCDLSLNDICEMLTIERIPFENRFGEYITNVLASSQWKEYITEIGYSIGDSSQPWQKNAWDTLLSHWTERGIVEASSIRIMNIALFRCPKLMDRFTFEQADRYIDKIVSRLERDIHKLNMAALVEYSNAPKFNDSKNKREYIALWKEGQKITALLELTLLILRLRDFLLL